MRGFKLVTSAVLLAAPVSTAVSADFGYLLRARVAVHCQVQHRSSGDGISSGGAVSLGQFREYCNAPMGYQLVVRYAPGALRGARLAAGADHVELDGSGEAVLSREKGPRFRDRVITATAGPNGFDTDRLEFHLLPM